MVSALQNQHQGGRRARLPGRQRQRHAAGQRSPDHVCRAASHSEDGARQAAKRPVFHASAAARLHRCEGRDLERRLRRPRTLHRATYRVADRPRHARSVRKYISSIGEPTWTDHELVIGGIATSGPTHRFGAVLFVEKEGFAPLLEHVQLAARFDIAITSSKGMSVTACRELADRMCSPRSPDVGSARLRQGRILDSRNASPKYPPLHISQWRSRRYRPRFAAR